MKTTLQASPRLSEHWPIEIDGLNKGDVITPEQIEEIYHVAPSDVIKYQLSVLKLKGFIERTRREIGLPVVCKCEGQSLRVLTDPEAVDYCASEFNRAMRSAARNHGRNICVDTANLDDNQKVRHERDCLVQGTILQAISTTRKQLKMESNRRKTPGILD